MTFNLNAIKHKNKLIFAVAILLFGICLKLYALKVVNLIARGQLEFRYDSYHFRMWQTNAHPYKVDFYFYNWTNSELFHVKKNHSIKPIFQEVGPYRFDMYINRTDVIIHSENDTITYGFTKRFIFVKEDDSRGLEDTIVTLNPVANAIAYQSRFWSSWAKLAISWSLRGTKSELFIRRSIRELLFEGYEDPLLNIARKLPQFAHLGLHDKFGYFYKRNYTDMYFGPYNVHAKVDENYGNLYTIKGSTQTPYFPGKCGRVVGKLGEYINPENELGTAHPLIIYIHDLNVYIENFFKEEKFYEGVLGSVYSPQGYVFDNGTFDKNNSCFCNGDCVPHGLLNSSATFKSAPVFMSLPHFHLADSSYLQEIDFRKSVNLSELLPYISIEKETGLLLEGALTTQLNLLLQPITGLGFFANVPKIFVPVFTMKQHVTSKGGYLKVLILMQKLPIIINILTALFLCVSVAMIYLFFKYSNVGLYYKPVSLK